MNWIPVNWIFFLIAGPMIGVWTSSSVSFFFHFYYISRRNFNVNWIKVDGILNYVENNSNAIWLIWQLGANFKTNLTNQSWKCTRETGSWSTGSWSTGSQPEANHTIVKMGRKKIQISRITDERNRQVPSQNFSCLIHLLPVANLLPEITNRIWHFYRIFAIIEWFNYYNFF